MKTRENKVTVNMDAFAKVENHATINDLMDKFYYCKAWTDLETRKTEKTAQLAKINIDIDLLYNECKRLEDTKTKGSFSSVDYSERMSEINDKLHGDGKKKGLLTRRDETIVALENIEKDKTSCVDEISTWKDTDGNTLTGTTDENVSYWLGVLNSLHSVDYRTIEILSVLSYGVSVLDARTKSIKEDLERYYAVAVAHGYSSDGYKQCKPLADIKKRIQDNLQGYLRSISIIYNEDGTSEGLFEPKVLNINATETLTFISTFFKGTKLDKNTGLETGRYESKSGVTGQIINLALCKFQNVPYGKPADKKQK